MLFHIKLLIALVSTIIIGCGAFSTGSSDIEPFSGDTLKTLVPPIFSSSFDSLKSETISYRTYQVVYQAGNNDTCVAFNLQLERDGWNSTVSRYMLGTEYLFKSILTKEIEQRNITIDLRCTENWSYEYRTRMVISN